MVGFLTNTPFKNITLPVVFLFLLPMGIYAQSSSNIEHTTEWKKFKESNGVEFFYKYTSCKINQDRSKEVVLLKLKNTTSQDKNVDWDIHLWYDGTCKTCNVNTGEYHHTVEVPSKGEKVGECGRFKPQTLQLFSKFIGKNGSVLTDFKLASLTVENIN